ncbi:hypothetical protein WCX49_13185 [Sulfurimonas sp. HSL-1656]|uniref:hypothetical protein n=1 Tax=Thiomicrolovo subterrani TaxID=3131934 RepID=UPI0031FA1CA7
MRIATVALVLLLAGLAGCSTKNIRIGGMMCPEGYSQEQIHQDMQECRFYGPAEDEAAAKAAFPRDVEPECIKCLEEKGYKITE